MKKRVAVTPMETSREEHLICHICLEFYTRPRALPCLHSFCESCLHEYINKNADPRRKQFACPVCRKIVTPPYPQRTLNEWTTCFPLNFTLASIVDSSPKEKESLLCDPCRFEQKKVSATKYCVDCKENLCAECTAFHKKTQILRSHKVVQLKGKESVLLSKPTEIGVEICSCQKRKEIEIFCADHEELCCTICATVKHRKCNEIQTVSDMDEVLLHSGELDAFLEEMKTSFEDCKNVLDSLEQRKIQLTKDRESVISSIRDARKMLEEHVERLEQHMLEETNAKFKEIAINIDKHLQEFQQVASDIQEQIQSLKDVAGKRQTSVFPRFKKAERKSKEIASQLKKEQSHSDIALLEFVLDHNLSGLKNNVKYFGNLTTQSCPIDSVVTSLNRLSMEETKVKEMSVTGLKKYNTITPGDASAGNTSGICFVSTDKLVLAESTNEMVKLLDLSGKLLDKLFIGQVWGATSIAEDAVAVTSSYGVDRGIHILSVHGTRLKKSGHIPMDRTCLGIASTPQELIVACMDPPSVQVFSMGGIVKQTITNPQFNAPHYLVSDATGNSLIVTDYNQNRVFGLSRNGEENFVYKGIKHPLGVTMDKRGTVFICGEYSNEVHAISSTTGKPLKVVLSAADVSRPQTMVYNKTNDSYFLTFDSMSNYTYQVWELKIKY